MRWSECTSMTMCHGGGFVGILSYIQGNVEGGEAGEETNTTKGRVRRKEEEGKWQKKEKERCCDQQV